MTSNSGSVWENPVRVMLREGKPVVGVTITTNCVEVAVQTASLGFDFLWIEMEHSPVNPETLRNVVLGTRGLTAIPFARVPVNELWTAKRVMDAGVMGVIFPFTSTPDLARQAATACKYPPLGRRGSGAGLASFRWPSPEDYYDFADRNMMVIAMIEEITAVEQIDAIAATPGIDVLFVGASDLSFSMGLRGRQDDPRLDEAISRVVAAGKRHQKFLGRPARNPDQLRKYMDQGFLLFQAASEVGLLAAGARQFLEPLGKRGDPAAGRLPY